MTVSTIIAFSMIIIIGVLWSTLEIEALPTVHFFGQQNHINWTQSEDRWDIVSIPRSIKPHVDLSQKNRNRTNPLIGEDHEAEFLEHLRQLKYNNPSSWPRMLWQESSNNNNGLVNKALKLFNLKQVSYEIENSVLSKVSCTACKAGAGLLLHYIHTGKSQQEIIKMIFHFCANLNIQSPRVCEGVSTLFGSEVIYVLQRTTLGPDEICSFVIGDGCGDVYNPYHEWDVVFPPVPKPPVTEAAAPKEGAPFFKVLHISDTHYDPHYIEGSNAECNEPLCCRLSSGKPENPNSRAGKWGDYRKCDTPKRTVDNMLSHIADTHSDIDYILWTGDLPPHDVWNQSKVENLEILKETVRQMVDKFPGVPIFPALGNHESAPVNSFPPPFITQDDNSISWLYDELDVQWRRWLPQSVSNTVKRGAFYSVLVRPGFRIISLNMNYCNNKNWWLLLNSTDPATELQWFIYELQSAEFSNEKVHVIGHIPPGHSDCLKVWSRNFYKIISRYENTVVAQFYGHTHFDEFELFYDPSDLTRPNNIAYIGPSVSPYYDLNPGYRIYYVDGDHDHTTRLVVDHESWIMNLKEANLYGYPIWYKLYAARSAYKMKALRPVDWDNLINEMANNQELFDLYYKNYWKNSHLRPACDAECRKRILCDAKSGRSHDRRQFCYSVEWKVDDDAGKSWKSWFYRGLSNSGLLSILAEALSNGEADSVTPVEETETSTSWRAPDAIITYA